MDITGLPFLFLFLPVSVVLYYVAGDRVKEYILLFVSLVFYAAGSKRYTVLLLIACAVTVAAGRGIRISGSRTLKRLLLIGGAAANTGILVYYKYTDFILLTLNRATGSDFTMRNLILPMGISFYTFKAISYLADVYSGKAVLHKNPLHDVLYLSFFAQIQSGPLSRYNEMQPKQEFIERKRFLPPCFYSGTLRFLIGFNKKVLLANMLAKITGEIFGASAADWSTSYVWLGSICYSLQLFFDFSGYSDMAIGLTEMFGYSCRENFNYPYMTESVSKFWRRWHISLSEWFRDYIYFPLGGSRNKRKSRTIVNLLVVWLLTGIWHGASWNFIFWGLGYFVLISFEHLTGLPNRFKTKAGKILYRVFTLVFINCEWVVFRAGSFSLALDYLKRMFVYHGDTLADTRTAFLIKDYFVFILFALILCFPVVPWLCKKMEGKRKTVFETVVCVFTAVMFVWALSFIVSGQNNPFLYANF